MTNLKIAGYFAVPPVLSLIQPPEKVWGRWKLFVVASRLGSADRPSMGKENSCKEMDLQFRFKHQKLLQHTSGSR